MNKATRKLAVRFEEAAEFAVPAKVQPDFGWKSVRELAVLKEKLLRQQLEAASDVRLYSALRHAAEEAASLAWTTPFPLLFLPALMEEKQREVLAHAQRQQDIRVRSQSLYAMAA